MHSRREHEMFKMKAELCKAFSDPKRLLIINQLRDGEKQVGDLALSLNLPQAVVSRQLAILRERGVVTPRREGASVYYSLADTKIIEACDLIHQVLLNHLAKNREIADDMLR